MSANNSFLDNLIDWTSPTIEPISRPLIPLPSYSSPIEISEDNPFDAIERKINEYEALDVFSWSLPCAFTDSDESKNSSFEEDFLLKLNSDTETVIEDNCSMPTQKMVDLNSCVERVAECNINDDSTINSSIGAPNVGSEFNESELKEIISSRISDCISRALNISSISKPNDTIISDSVSSSKKNSYLNDAFMFTLNSESKFERSKSIESNKAVTEFEDLLSIVPKWDEALSSSDEETEIQCLSKSLPIHANDLLHRVMSKDLKEKKLTNIREPLLAHNPNVKNIKPIRKVLKTEPLKAIVPMSNMKKSKGKINSDEKNVIQDKLTVPTSFDSNKNKRCSRPAATSTPQSRRSNVFKNSTKTAGSKSLVSECRSRSRAPSPDSTTHSKSLISNHRITSAHKTRVSTSFTSRSSAVSSSSELLNSKLVSKIIRNKENAPFKL